MIAPTLVGLTSICIAAVSSRVKVSSYGLILSLLPIFLFLALRYNYGNDYSSYIELFDEISAQGQLVYNADEWHVEAGWFELNRLFSDIGFFPMVMCLAFFNCYAFGRFVKRFVPRNYYWVAIFIYCFVPDNLLIQASAMRQGVAISLCLISIEFLLEKEFIKYVFIVLFASLFHTSAMVLIPFGFVGALNFSIKRSLIPLFIGLYIALFFFADLFISFVLDSFAFGGFFLFERYLYYDTKGVVGTGAGLVFQGIYLATLLYFHDNQNKDGRLIFRLVIIGLYILPFSTSVMMISRLTFYFFVASVAAVPLILVAVNNNIIRRGFVFLYAVFVFYSYISFFESPVWGKSFGEYHTIFSESARR